MQFDPMTRGTRFFAAASFLFGSSESDQVLDAIPARIAVVDGMGRIRVVNAAWRAMDGQDFFAQAFDRGLNYLDLCDSVRGQNGRAAWSIAAGLRAVLDGRSPSVQTDYSWTLGTETRHYKCMISPLGGEGGASRSAVLMHVDMDTPAPTLGAGPLPAPLPVHALALEGVDRIGSETLRSVEAIADQIPALVGYVDADLTCRAANRQCEDWFGVPAGAIVGMPLADVAGHSLYQRIEGHVQKVLAGREVTFEDVFETRPGERRWFRATYVPDMSRDGRVRGFSTLAYDITSVKEMEQRLDDARQSAEHCTRAQSAFLEHVGHELKSPLTAVVGFAETLASELFGPLSDQYRDYARDIRDTACGLGDLVNDLVDLARIQAGQLHLDEERIDLGALLSNGLGRAEQAARDAGVTLRVTLPRHVPGLFADERLVRQTVLNVLLSGIGAAADGGHVTLEVRREADGGLSLVLTDHERSLPPGDLDRLLEPFARHTPPRTPAAIGVGLALPLARHYMALHDGTLTLTGLAKAGVATAVTFPRARVVG